MSNEGVVSMGTSPGDLLRQARQAQGLELDTVAAMIKVTPAKLEALELGHYDQLLDPNFTRALAMTVCRSLKIDSAPILAGLPAAKSLPLSPNKPALNQPFKESRGANLSFDSGWSFNLKVLLRPQWLAPLLLLLASVVVYVLPESFRLPSWSGYQSAAPVPTPSASVPTPVAQVPSEPEAVPELIPADPGAASAPASAMEASSPQVPAASASVPVGVAPPASSALPASVSVAENPLVLTSREPAWVEVRDANGSKLLSRHLTAGEVVTLNGATPYKLLLGNAMGLQLNLRGQSIDLNAYTRNNIARFELK
ncbi:MAG: RodZ domain-containing protein [Pseudomonadota bacterium]